MRACLLAWLTACATAHMPQGDQRQRVIPDPTVLASGGDARRVEPWCICEEGTEAGLQKLWSFCSTAAPPVLAAPGGTLVGVFVGPGAGERLQFVEALRKDVGAVLVFRFRAIGAARTTGRFCLLQTTLPGLGKAALEVELDVGTAAAPAWQLQCVHPPFACPGAGWPGQRLEPLVAFWSPRRTATVCADVLAFEQEWRSLAPGVPLPDVDFARSVVVALPGSMRGTLGAAYRSIVRGGALDDRNDHGCLDLFVAPRAAFPFEIERSGAGIRAPYVVDQRLLLDDPQTVPRLPILRRAGFPVIGQSAPVCERARTPDEWRALRDRLQLPGEGLPDDWCDFTCACVIAVAPGRARTNPPFTVAVEEKDGADVLTWPQEAQRPNSVERTPCLLLQVPVRSHSLRVVLGATRGAGERTVGTFAPLR
jgi:hypothetical protein